MVFGHIGEPVSGIHAGRREHQLLAVSHEENYYEGRKGHIVGSIAVSEFEWPRVVRERLAAVAEIIFTGNRRPMAVIMYVDDEDDPEGLL